MRPLTTDESLLLDFEVRRADTALESNTTLSRFHTRAKGIHRFTDQSNVLRDATKVCIYF